MEQDASHATQNVEEATSGTECLGAVWLKIISKHGWVASSKRGGARPIFIGWLAPTCQLKGGTICQLSRVLALRHSPEQASVAEVREPAEQLYAVDPEEMYPESHATLQVLLEARDCPAVQGEELPPTMPVPKGEGTVQDPGGFAADEGRERLHWTAQVNGKAMAVNRTPRQKRRKPRTPTCARARPSRAAPG